MVYLFLADGFEIIEALAPIDMLRRGKVEIKTVGVAGKRITSSCGVEVTADITIDEFDFSGIDAIILPGGMPGTVNLENCTKVQEVIDYSVNHNKLICAICAAPSILGHKGLLKGKNATAFPGYDTELEGAILADEYVIRDGNFITARGAGVSVDFGLEILKALTSEDTSNKIRKKIQCK